MSRSDLALFLANLRLLDLDTLPDWPEISKQTFNTKDQSNQKNRIRCTEWALYRLFEIWDPVETRSKLQPFFPPFEPLQSINLRAALFRCLNELKKTGVLGRETVLRKTMLDECKGDKFIEILLVFSLAVLKKQIGKSQNGRQQPIARRVAQAAYLKPSEQDKLIPLAIAHAATVRNCLARRDERKALFADIAELLAVTADDIAERERSCQANAKRIENELDGVTEQGALRKVLRDHWVANQSWLNVVLHGDEKHGEDEVLEGSYADFLSRVTPGDTMIEPSTTPGLLEDLNRRVELQEGRLHRWKAFYEQRMETKREVANAGKSKEPKAKHTSASLVEFTKHEQIKIGTAAAKPDEKMQQKSGRFQDIVGSMLQGLEEAENKLESDTQTRPGKPSPIIERRRNAQAAAGAQQKERLDRTSRVPVEQPKSHSLPSGLTSTHNKYEDGLTPEPKSRIRLQDSAKVLTCGDSPPPDAAKTLLPGTDLDKHTVPALMSSRQTQPDFDDIPRLDAQRPASPTSPSPKQSLADQIVASVSEATPSPVKRPRPSLAERTRMSMAAFSAPANDLQSIAESPLPQPSEIPASDHSTDTDTIDRRTTLLERTRQSMSLMSGPKPRKSLTQRKSRQSRQSLFPVNQFETPRKKDAWLEEEEVEEDVTVGKEDLFSEEADYASVFKPRPKIAHSPVPSPSFVEEETVTPGAEYESSPLGRFERRRG